MTALFLYTLLMSKDNVSWKLFHKIDRAKRLEFYEKNYDLTVKILDPYGDIGLAEAELSYEELMWLSAEADKQ